MRAGGCEVDVCVRSAFLGPCGRLQVYDCWVERVGLLPVVQTPTAVELVVDPVCDFGGVVVRFSGGGSFFFYFQVRAGGYVIFMYRASFDPASHLAVVVCQVVGVRLGIGFIIEVRYRARLAVHRRV